MEQPIINKPAGPRRWVLLGLSAAAGICVCVVAVAALVVVSGPLATVVQTQTSPQNNAVATNGPLPVNASAAQVQGLPEPPQGFNWQGIPGLSPAFLVPDGWYFTAELGPGFNTYYATREKELNTAGWVYSTGLSISALDAPDKANAAFARDYLEQYTKKESTTRVVESSQDEQGNVLVNKLLVEAEYTTVAQDHPNRKKTVYYSSVLDKTAGVLYVISFEGPTPSWETEWKNGQVMIDRFVEQLTSRSAQPAGANSLANTTLLPFDATGLARPGGMQDAVKSKLLKTTGGGFLNEVPAAGEPWRQRYFLTVEADGSLPAGAVLQAQFESPHAPGFAIVVRRYQLTPGPLTLETPSLGGFKCQNYWVIVQVFSDASQGEMLDSYIQWINSQADLDKVSSVSDFANGSTCK